MTERLGAYCTTQPHGLQRKQLLCESLNRQNSIGADPRQGNDGTEDSYWG